MKLTNLILTLLLIGLHLTAETDTGTTDAPETPPAGENSAEEAPAPSPAPEPKEEKGECTVGSCYFCQTDGETQWCERCGNGMAISALEGKKRSCNKKLTIENCREAPKDDPTNADKCGECQRGFGLTDGKCKKLEMEGCTIPGMDSDGNVVCNGCEGQFLKDDQSGCAENPPNFLDIFPKNCLFGSKLEEAKCLICGHNYRVSKTGKSCPQDMVTGCDIYHPNEPQKCLLCNNDEGFYATEAVSEGGDVYQECEFNGYLVKAFAFVLGFTGFVTGL